MINGYNGKNGNCGLRISPRGGGLLRSVRGIKLTFNLCPRAAPAHTTTQSTVLSSLECGERAPIRPYHDLLHVDNPRHASSRLSTAAEVSHFHLLVWHPNHH